MYVGITENDQYIVIDIVHNGRYMIHAYNKRVIDISYAREQAAELARVCGCEVKENKNV